MKNVLSAFAVLFCSGILLLAQVPGTLAIGANIPMADVKNEIYRWKRIVH